MKHRIILASCLVMLGNTRVQGVGITKQQKCLYERGNRMFQRPHDITIPHRKKCLSALVDEVNIPIQWKLELDKSEEALILNTHKDGYDPRRDGHYALQLLILAQENDAAEEKIWEQILRDVPQRSILEDYEIEAAAVVIVLFFLIFGFGRVIYSVCS